jgi:LCP family protein required for cell wall assembly
MRLRRSKKHKSDFLNAEAGALAAPGAGARKAPHRMGFLKTFALGFVALLLIFVPIQFAVSSFLEKPVIGESEALPDFVTAPQGDPADPTYAMYRDAERLNILLLGINSGLTDTIMLGSYDMKNNKLDIISVPRDTYFDRPEANTAAQRKINAIYYKGGASGTAAAVSKVLMGMPIHYYAVVKYEGVAQVVDSINGVPVDIKIDMDYDDYYADPELHIHFKKGEQVLMGDDAIKYLRFRKNNNKTGYPEGDIGRIAAQQEFMKAALKKAIGINLPKVVETVLQNVETDVKIGVAAKLAMKAARLDGDDVASHLTPGEAHMQDGLSYWFTDEAAIEDMVKGIYMPEAEEATGGAVDPPQ